jgi:hypothetical protein
MAMRNKTSIMVWIGLVCLLASGAASALAMAGQDAAPPPLAEQLRAQYSLVKLGKDSGGLAVVEPGTVLVIQKGGILGVPFSYAKWEAGAAKYEDGVFHPSRGLGWLQTLNRVSDSPTQIESRFFQTNDKVYPLKIDVNLKSEKISFGVVACDSCNGTNPPTFYKGEVVFQFAKGYLEKGNVSEIEDTIGQVLSIDNGSSVQQTQGQPGGQDQGQAPTQPAAAPAPAGMTSDDVVKMAQAKMSDSIIVKKIKNSACSFDTSADGLVKLKNAGVSEAVIEAMVEKQ